ncbi:MAG: hypothetical protein KDA22_01780 [Phycisphaerales bacterium]|nr:hypothetical protein [Phycisphaerales bacterium]
MSSTYAIGRHTGICAATGAVLAPGTPCVAALCEEPEGDGLVRRDYAIAAWDSGQRPPRLFSCWRTVVPEPDAPRRMLVDDQTLVDIFERLEGDERPQRLAFRFVLGLILLRKRLLRQVGRERRGDREAWLMLPRGAVEGERPVEVIDPRLGEDDIRTIGEQFSEILQTDL